MIPIMKTSSRIHRKTNTNTTASQGQKPSELGQLTGIFLCPGWKVVSIIDAELQEIAGSWSASKRRVIAKKFSRWVIQLKESADFMDFQSAISNIN
jgi:hypothetical protein